MNAPNPDGSWRRDDGRIAVFFAIIAPAWFALLGLVVVGGNRIMALQRADNIAAEAARAAGQAIDLPSAMVGGEIRLDPEAAAAEAEDYVRSAGARLVSISIAPDRRHLSITVEVTYEPGPFGMFGGAWTAEGDATVALVVV
jgi:hypothetical protein